MLFYGDSENFQILHLLKMKWHFQEIDLNMKLQMLKFTNEKVLNYLD